MRLRFTEPELERPFRVPRQRAHPRRPRCPSPRWSARRSRSRSGSSRSPPTTRRGSPGRSGSRSARVVFVGSSRHARGSACSERVEPADRRPRPRPRGRVRAHPRADEARPDRRGGARRPRSGSPRSSGCEVHVLHVIRVPLDAAARRGADRRRGAGRGVARRGDAARGGARGRDRGHIVRAPRDRRGDRRTRPTSSSADLIVMGSAPRWRRQSRFFSPTVDYVLRKAPCEVMVSPTRRASWRKPWRELI